MDNPTGESSMDINKAIAAYTEYLSSQHVEGNGKLCDFFVAGYGIALAHQEQEPLCWLREDCSTFAAGYEQTNDRDPNGFPVFTAPPAKAAEQWIACSDRLPTEQDGDVWVWDADEKFASLEHWSQVVMFRDRYDYTHWKPTGLVRPEPPKEGEK